MWLVVALGCGGASTGKVVPLADLVPASSESPRTTLRFELVADMLDALRREESLVEAALPAQARAGFVGVGAADMMLGASYRSGLVRYPLRGDLVGTVSLRLRAHVAADLSAAWIDDEISVRMRVCGRLASVPLRWTALLMREGDRWLGVMEHVSYAHAPTLADALPPSTLGASVVSSRLEADALSRVLGSVWRTGPEPRLATSPDAVLIGPARGELWRGPAISQRALLAALTAPGPAPVVAPEHRVVGTLGGRLATVAYWAGTFEARVNGRTTRLRGTFVFERRRPPVAQGASEPAPQAEWHLVQGHVSHAIEDADLAARVFGIGVVATDPLVVECP